MHLAKDQHHNDRLVQDLLKEAYGKEGPTIEDLIRDGLIAGSNLAEVAISRKSGIDLCPEGIYRDLVDDTDVKTITVQKKSFFRVKNGKKTKERVPRYQAVVKHCHKKIGVLRVICYNPFSGKYFYFMIPPSAYIAVKNITIAFDKETQECNSQYQAYLVESFDDVCKSLSLREKIDQLVCNIDKKNATESMDKLMTLINEKNGFKQDTANS